MTLAKKQLAFCFSSFGRRPPEFSLDELAADVEPGTRDAYHRSFVVPIRLNSHSDSAWSSLSAPLMPSQLSGTEI